MNKRQVTALVVVLALLAGTAVLLARMGAVERLGRPGLKLVAEPMYTGGQLVRTQSVSLPTQVLEYTSAPEEITPLELNWLPKDTLFGRKRYLAPDGFQALTSVVLMGTDRTSIHKPQFCLDGQGWRIEKSDTVSIPMTRPHPYDLRAMRLLISKESIENGQRVKTRGIYVYWFVADNLLTPYHGERMWWMARDLIYTGVLQRWAYVTYLTACPPGQEELYFSRLKELIAASVPEFQLAAGPPPQVRSTAAAQTQ